MAFAKQSERKDPFQGTDLSLERRKRNDDRVALRERVREGNLNKKRQLLPEIVKKQQEQKLKPNKPLSLIDDSAFLQQVESIPSLAQHILSGDPAMHLQATVQLRKLLSTEHNPPIQEVVQLGVVPRLIEFLHSGDSVQLQLEAAWALTNISAGTSEHTGAVVGAGAVPVFVGMIAHSPDELKEQAVWALGNIAGDNPETRDYVLNSGVLEPLMKTMARTNRTQLLRNAAWAWANFFRGRPPARLELLSPVLPLLAPLLWNPDEEVVADSCWAFGNFVDGPPERLDRLLEMDFVLPRIVDLLLSTQTAVQTPALRVIGHIVLADDRHTDAVIACEALPALCTLLSHNRRVIRKESCWAVSNIAAGLPRHINAVLGANLVPPLIHLLKCQELDVRKEAAFALMNIAVGGSKAQIRYIVEQGVVPALCEALRLSDTRVVGSALQTLYCILRVGKEDAERAGGQSEFELVVRQAGGLASLAALQLHDSNDIYCRASRIKQDFFDAAGEDDEFEVPPPQGQSFPFTEPTERAPVTFTFQQ